MENTLNSRKKGAKYYHRLQKIPYIVQMLYLRRKVVPGRGVIQSRAFTRQVEKP